MISGKQIYAVIAQHDQSIEELAVSFIRLKLFALAAVVVCVFLVAGHLAAVLD